MNGVNRGMQLILHACPSRPCPPPLAVEEVHVWSVPLKPPSAGFEELREDLTAEERVRAERYRAGHVREQFIAGRGFLRRVLGGYLNVSPSEVPITYEASGKPVLSMPGVRFNLTHTDGLALIAVASHRVGVDLERVREVPNAEGLVDRFFSTAEREAYRALPKPLQPAAFFRAWTCKEAVIKAVGASIESLDAFDVEMHPERPAAVLDSRHGAIGECKWALSVWSPGAGFAAAVAVEVA